MVTDQYYLGGKVVEKVKLVGAVYLVDWLDGLVSVVKLVKWLGCWNHVVRMVHQILDKMEMVS